jgi:hypothetical protein
MMYWPCVIPKQYLCRPCQVVWAADEGTVCWMCGIETTVSAFTVPYGGGNTTEELCHA